MTQFQYFKDWKEYTENQLGNNKRPIYTKSHNISVKLPKEKPQNLTGR